MRARIHIYNTRRGRLLMAVNYTKANICQRTQRGGSHMFLRRINIERLIIYIMRVSYN